MGAFHHGLSAIESAQRQVEAVRDDPDQRMALLNRLHGEDVGISGLSSYRRAAASFMSWQVRRGLLRPSDSPSPGSRWWRAVNERLLRDQCEALAARRTGGGLSSAAVVAWSEFLAAPCARRWYRAHNGSIVAAYLEYRSLAEYEDEVERFFLNAVLGRVLYAHALAAAPRLALGSLAPLGRIAGDPRLGAVGLYLSLGRILPTDYPANGVLFDYLRGENVLGRLVDYEIIIPRLQRLYEWSAHQLDQPGLMDMIDDGAPTYAWPSGDRWVWRQDRRTVAGRLLRSITELRQP